MQGLAPQLQFHLAVGLNIGFTESQLMQIFPIIETYIGKPQADLAKNVFVKMVGKK